MRKSIIRTLSFVIILCLVLSYTNHVFKFKYGDGIYDMELFYEQEPNTVDVLFLGSSHAFEDFNTGVLWNEFGIASYVLGGSVQPMWNTYFFLKEALKTQTPKLIVLEAYMTHFQHEYVDDSRIIKNTYGMKWSLNKIEAIKESAPKERWGEFLLEYVQYHTRYAGLDYGDFYWKDNSLYKNCWKGYGCNTNTYRPQNVLDVTHIQECNSMSEKTEKYYRLIIELAQQNNIPILIVVNPYSGITEMDKQCINEAEKVAAEYNVPFFDYNLQIEKIGIDFSKDVADEAHLNHRGSAKLSRYIGDYIAQNYNIIDRRGDVKYTSWEKQAYYIDALYKNQSLLESWDIHSMTVNSLNSDYRLIISVDGNCNIEDPRIKEILQEFGITYAKNSSIWYLDNEEKTIWSSGIEASEYYVRIKRTDICLKHINNEQSISNMVIINNQSYKQVTNGINIVIYDTITEKIIEVYGIDIDNDYEMSRMFAS